MIKTAAIIEKPWGHEEIWASSTRYVGKILYLKKGHRLSRQYHRVKEETIMVVEGILTLETGPQHEGDPIICHTLLPGGIFHIPPGTVHRFCAEKDDVKVVEVSTPEIRDVVRLEDDYRRITDHPIPLKTSGK
jgi:quercetin dioxygenase-like cupin family protein